MKMKKVLLVLAVLMFSTTVAKADNTLNLTLGQMYRDLGLNLLNPNSTIALFVNTSGSDLFDPAVFQSATAWSTDSNIVLLDRWASNDNFGPGSGTATASTSYNQGAFGIATGDPLLLVWYDTPYVESALGAGGQVNYGMFRSENDPNLLPADIPWRAPADGATNDLVFLTASFGGPDADTAGFANFQTAPEPVSAVLGILGGGAMVLRRRLNRAKA
ncbi:MAG: hypothetical protein KC618_04355 [Candidatus Omnitrophica bacterium]|nr:hypothetical protein [Candidatus Omnitrophota bacterium]